MMNDFDLQWKVLAESGHSSGKLRVYPDHALDLFVDYSLAGNREMIIEAKGVPYLSTDLPFFENLDVTFKEIFTVCLYYFIRRRYRTHYS